MLHPVRGDQRFRLRVQGTLEVLLRLFVRQHVDPFVAQATQIDGMALDTITRNISFVLLALTPGARNEMMRRDLTLTAA